MNHAMHAPLEIKSDPEHDDNNHDADNVEAAITGFKSAVDDRLAALETKSADDKKRDDRLKALETRLARPGAGVEIKTANDNGEIERKAFVSYLRRGVERMPTDEAKALTVAVGATAGYLAPVQFGNEILKQIVQFSPIRSYAKVMQVSAPEIIFPRRVSTINAQWVGEIDPRPASAPAFEQVTLTPFELAVYVDVSNQLLEDNAYDLEGELSIEFGESFAQLEGAAFVNGNGVGKPMGLMTSPQITSVVKTTANGKVGLADLITAYHALPGVYAQSASWLMNRATLGSLRGINDANGRPLLLDPVTAGASTTLLGRPIVEMVDMPASANGAFPIIFGDLSGYRIVDRVGLSTLRDPFSLATVGQTRLHARKRVGGDVTNPDRFVKLQVSGS